MKNNKGFTLVEILAAVSILGILSVMALGAYMRYADYAKNQSYKVMAKSASTAAEEYIMDNPGDALETVAKVVDGKTTYEILNVDSQPGVTFETLIEEGYMNGAEDPNNRSANCAGTVRIGLVSEKTITGSHKDGVLDRYIFVVDECCSSYKARFTYSYEKDGEKTTSLDTVDRNTVICS